MPQTKNRHRCKVSSRSRGAKDIASTGGPQRLQKVLAAAGIASRRQCETLILEGRVEVDQRVVTKLGTKVDLETQSVQVDGVPLVQTQLVYYIINKPTGVVCTHRDPSGRMRIIDLVPDETARMFSVGRLDRESEGLILLTNDGGLAQQLAHPRYGVEKTYHVQVAGLADRAVLQRLREGVQLAEGKVGVAAVRMKRAYKQSTILEINLREGKNREIRRMLAALGHKVQRLKRVGLGPLKLGKLPQGEARPLTQSELFALRGDVAGEGKLTQRNRTRSTDEKSGRKKHGQNTKGSHSDRPNGPSSRGTKSGTKSGAKSGAKKTRPRPSKKKKRVQKKR